MDTQHMLNLLALFAPKTTLITKDPDSGNEIVYSPKVGGDNSVLVLTSSGNAGHYEPGHLIPRGAALQYDPGLVRLVSKTTSYAYELDTDEDHYFVLDEAFAVVEAEKENRPFDEKL